ncbi:hypothetical protein [Dickeya aquatica]|uniref:Uncharacterized protein n=1 Tax=Dickeya aquatica TaxID=1401087 RepID=A0A375ABD8_9GAMM|nr:hypothetical protein [Dickeya aquatica]SLM63236.1 hypothetical protein DAQ1742_02345 [Dickeya aquatica]
MRKAVPSAVGGGVRSSASWPPCVAGNTGVGVESRRHPISPPCVILNSHPKEEVGPSGLR